MATNEVSQAMLEEWTALLAAIKDSATPALAERLGEMMATVGQFTQQMTGLDAQETLAVVFERKQTLQVLLDQVEQWQKDGTWTRLTELAQLLAGIQASATAPLAERLGLLAAQMGPLVARLTEADTQVTLDQLLAHQQDLQSLLDQLAGWQKDGTWAALTQWAGLLKALTDSLNPLMVERLVTTFTQLGEFVNQLISSGGMQMVLYALQQLTEAKTEAQQDPHKITLGSLLRMLKDPEIQQGMKTLLSVLRRLPSMLDPLS